MKTGLIRKMSAPQGLEVEIRSFGKNLYAKGATGENQCAEGTTVENRCAEGT